MKHVAVCDRQGNIVSIARSEPTTDPKGPGGGLAPKPKRGLRVLEVDVPGEAAKRFPNQLVDEYRVDLKTGQLVRRTGSRNPE